MQAGGEHGNWGYRPYLDGLRAVAVYLVVAFHSGMDRFTGGFIGVDVFFVLSGYLVTTILLRDLHGSGSIRFGRFYSRRVRRLLPAAVVNLAVTAAVFAAIAPPSQQQGALDAIRAAALYVSNWYFIGQAADYFATDINAGPVIQYWSLSVEEQFYLLWPLALAGLAVLARRARSREQLVMRSLVVAGGLASLAAALLIARTDPSRAYFGTDTRAYQLLGGAALAMTPGVARLIGRRAGLARALTIACLGALVLLATSSIDIGPVSRGAATTAVTMLLIVSLEAASAGIGRRVLSWGPLTYLGRISYGTYLWHWLVILVIEDAYSPSPAFTFALSVLVATGIASLSFQLLEQPIRVAPVLDRFRVPVIATGLVASLLVGVAIAPRMLDRTDPSRAAHAAAGTTNGTPNRADWQAAKNDNYEFGDCLPLEPFECPLARGNGETVVIVGDSHATMLTPMIVDLARRLDLSVSGAFLLACPWTHGIRYAVANDSCFEHQDKVFDELIPAIDPDIVVLAQRPVDDPRNGVPLLDREDGELDTSARRHNAMQRSVSSVVRDLRDDGRKVVIVEPIPVPPKGDDPLDCLSKAAFIEECRFVVPEAPTDQEKILRAAAAENEGVWSLDLDPLICPYLPICDPVVNGLVSRSDDNHVTVTFGRTLLDPFEQLLRENRILD